MLDGTSQLPALGTNVELPHYDCTVPLREAAAGGTHPGPLNG
jgi:hypothetical protein